MEGERKANERRIYKGHILHRGRIWDSRNVSNRGNNNRDTSFNWKEEERWRTKIRISRGA